MTVYALTIEHTNGTDAWVYTTEKRAWAKLRAWMKEYWADEVGPDVKMPKSLRSQLIRFFEDSGTPYTYNLNECIVDED